MRCNIFLTVVWCQLELFRHLISSFCSCLHMPLSERSVWLRHNIRSMIFCSSGFSISTEELSGSTAKPYGGSLLIRFPLAWCLSIAALVRGDEHSKESQLSGF